MERPLVTRAKPHAWLQLAMGAGLIVLVSCSGQPSRREVIEFAGPTMGTRWTVRVVPPAGRQVVPSEHARIQRTLQATLIQIERLMSTWDKTSELSRFNASASLEPFDVAPETFEVFRLARALSVETGGTMDPTVAGLVEAWGFGADRAVPLPDAATVERLRADVGMSELIDLDPGGRWVRKRRPGVGCTFSALAPGYAADRLAALLVSEGYRDVLVDVGGELVAKGRNAEGQPWQVAVERPQTDGRAIERVVPLVDQAISTSGDYRNFRQVEGGRLPHILDPRTGRPVNHNLASVSVIAREAVRADALSTALLVMGPDAAMAFAAAHDLAVLLVVRTADGRLEERVSAGFPPASP